jgi:TolB-like protein/DNA-binding winged helix-turn-helix (wHTH) protein/Tfp pilus assembly protein PilF
MASVNINETIRFADYELNPQTYRLSRAGHTLRLERIPTEILIFLIERQGELVSREQIAEKIWGKDVFVDTDNSINGAVRKIRQALKDDAEQPRFIQTITGRGYRFIGDIEESESAASTPSNGNGFASPTISSSVPAQASSATAADSSPQRRMRPRVVVAAALAFVLLLLVAGWIAWSKSQKTTSPSGKFMLAVLPFENLTGDASQEYFSDGLTEEMITQLGGLDPVRLGVIGRTSVMHYKETRTPLDQISRELGVRYLLEGSVRRDGRKVRITAQLIQSQDQTHLWAREYDRELTELLAVQREIAQEIAKEVQITLGNGKSAQPGREPLSTQEVEAYDFYLRGQYFLSQRSVPALEEAIAYYQQATVKDPRQARAFAGIADAYGLLGGYSGRPQQEEVAKARAAAWRALEIDEGLAEAHAALALIAQNYDWNWQAAEREFRRAIELNPNYATGHHWYAEHLMWRGQFDEALVESERARQLDPLSLIIAADNGAILYYSRQYDSAIEKWHSVLAIDPQFQRAQLIEQAYIEKGMFDEAIAGVELTRTFTPDHWYWCNLAYAYGRANRSAEARHALQELLRIGRRETIDPRLLAWAYLGLGEKDKALEWLEKAYAKHSNEMVSLKVNPGYDTLRGEPRFHLLLRRVGLED